MDDRMLDHVLTAWAKSPVAPGNADAAAEAALAARPAPRRWWPVAAGGGALAASVALALVALPWNNTVQAPVKVASVAPVTAPPADDAESYAYQLMFTETLEEEMAI